jgi:hypothetical protein
MSILRTKFKKKEENDAYLVGAQVPRRLASYLSLFCLAKGQTKTSVLKPLLEDWVDDNQSETSIDVLIKEIALNAYSVWKAQVRQSNFNTFKNQVKRELTSKGLSGYSDRILNIITDEKNKEKDT